MTTFYTLFKTELKLSFRGMDMFIFAICMPVIAMVILGIVYGTDPAYPGADYTFIEQSFGAVSTIAIAAGGVMGLPLVISDYRDKKILKRLQVTPTSPTLLLAVQFLVYAFYALTSLGLVFLTGYLFFGLRLEGSLILFLGAYALVLLSLFSIGLLVGGVSPNIKIASVLASLLYFPMLLFSGATLPYEIMPSAMQSVSEIMPLTQGIKLLKAISLGYPVENVWFALTSLIALAVLSVSYFKWE
ncbi:MAG: ABC transporter permease [Alkalibacterium sp.]|nr:ABC transporter permease [Alkalibacterium sp.]